MTQPGAPREGEPEYDWSPEEPAGTPPRGAAHPPTRAYGVPHEPTRADGVPLGDGAGDGDTHRAARQAAYQPTVGAGVPVPGHQGGAAPLPGAQPLVTIGDITVLPDAVVTPAGTMPLRGAVWNAVDMTRTEDRTPVYAIVLAVLFVAACGLGLLFLLLKEKRTTGFVQATVSGAGIHHTAAIPATGPGTYTEVMAQIAYARSISAG
ncbi:hypothetical protein [Streptomyces genisteinicus]|uniref:Uncharacterized protein n=1 Tax=Streptomyces genisteinicus TaxID=2768068 RepID=A0A7H0HWG1_9ACTN|nr:hypothetical protein [Streptomyces genisteinicus]QNP64877.1 hypothetical protein IAG43_19465 [Streptomyces genisteinicus]